MFRESVQASAYAVGSAAAERGYALDALPNTFLDTLVTLAKNHNSLLSAELGAELRVDASQTTMSLYRLTVDELVVSGAQVITRNLNLARTDAVSLIGRVMNGFKEIIDPSVPYAYSKAQVVVLTYPEILSSDFARSIVGSFNGEIDERIGSDIVLSLDEEQYQDLIALAKTGISTVDAMVDKLVQGLTSNDLRHMFEQAFGQGLVYTSMGDGERDILVRGAFLTHLWATKLRDAEFMPSKSRYSKIDYTNQLVTMQSVTARVIEAVTKRREFDSRNNQLVLQLRDECVVVNGDLYEEWLKKGGKPEILLGAGLESADAVKRSGEELIEDARRYVAAWNSYVSVIEERRRQDLKGVARQEIFQLLRGIIDERHKEGFLAAREDALELLNERCHNFEVTDLNNPYRVIRDLVLDIFYVTSDVPCIVRGMDELAASDPDLSADDLATLGTIKYVSEWAAKFIVKTRVNA